MISIKDKKVVIVGASSGIGKALAQRCTEDGAVVYLLSRSEEKLKKVRETIGGESFVVPMNMLEEDSVNQAFEKIGRFDFMSFTAVADETKLSSPVKTMPTETAQRGMEKFWGTFYCCRAAAQHISSEGAIVVTSSVAIFRPSKNNAIMNAASAAVNVFAKALARELAPTRVNIIAPGVVGSGVWTDKEKEEYRRWAIDTLPVAHLGTPEELAHMYYSVMLNPYMTGSLVSVDGGLSLI